MSNEVLKTLEEEGFEISAQKLPPSLLDIFPYSELERKQLGDRPTTKAFKKWLGEQLIAKYSHVVSPDEYYIGFLYRKKVFPLIDSFIRNAVENTQETTDTKSPAEKYCPITDEWVDEFYGRQERKTLSGIRANLLSEKTEHNFQNSLLIVVDQQAAFGAQPGSPAAQKVIQERSFGEENLKQMAEFVRKVIDLGPWVILTTMQHGWRTTVDRWKQQRNLGLVNNEGDFLLCSEGSSDVMIQPLLLKHLGLNSKEVTKFEYQLLTHALSRDVGKVVLPGKRLHFLGQRKQFSFFLGDYLPVIVKPERGFSGENLRQIMCVEPSDIFIAGTDIHVCLAEIVEQLKLGWGYQPNIWIVYNLSTTRPGDFDIAKKTVANLADYNHFVYLVSKAQAEKLLGRNKRTVNDLNQPKNPFPSLEEVIQTRLMNITERLTYNVNVSKGKN